MKTIIHSIIAALCFAPAALFAADSAKNCGCDCCKGKDVCCCHQEKSTTAPAQDQAERHPLKGVVVDVKTERSALMVKHEAIPGVMRAMTMQFKVDAATLAAVTKGQAITGTMVNREDGFWLEDVKPAK